MSHNLDGIQLSISDVVDISVVEQLPEVTEAPKLDEKLASRLFDGLLNTYAILDAAKIPNLTELLDAEGIAHECLFVGEAKEDYGNVAPWIAKLSGDERFMRLLFSKTPKMTALWQLSAAVFVCSSGSLKDVQAHFRRLTKVPRVDGPELYFRFWDPDVAHGYLSGVAQWSERIQSLLVSRHAVINRFVVPLCEEQCARVFDLDCAKLSKQDVKPMRLEKRDLAILADLQWPRLKRDLAAWIGRADPVRFRSFDAKRRAQLAEHAVREGRAFGLTYKEEYAYFLYMMTFLGGWFHKAPQFTRFRKLLLDSSDERYLIMKREFPQLYKDVFGHLVASTATMKRLHRRIEQCLSICGGWDGMQQEHVAIIVQEVEQHLGWSIDQATLVRSEADAQAAALALNTPRDQELHYLMWLLIGPHYLTDPIFPWAGEKYLAADQQHVAILDVASYAYRRLSRTLSLERILQSV